MNELDQIIFNKMFSQIQAGIPILFIEHFDYEGSDLYLKSLQMSLNAEIHEYRTGSEVHFETKILMDSGQRSLADFLSVHNSDCECDEEGKENKILVLKDVQDSLRQPEVITHLRMIAERTMRKKRDENTRGVAVYIFIVSDELDIPRELEHFVRVIRFEPPTEEQIRSIVSHFISEFGLPLEIEDQNELISILNGMSDMEIHQSLRLGLFSYGLDFEGLRKSVSEEKDQVIRKSKLLKAITVCETLDDVGGLENLIEYLKRKSRVFANRLQAARHHVDMPKGILIVGMPGCGKSLTAKVTALQFRYPLLQLDIGMLLGKYVGESEENFRKAIRMAESVAPCVLWIDEIEKAFAGMQQAQGGGNEVTTRLFGNFLTWMQEKKSPVYVIATSNSCSLPQEFYRKGRFDEVFSVYLPLKEERKKILEIHLKKRNCSISPETLKKVVNNTEGFCGADLESIVKEALENAFLQGLDSNFEQWSDRTTRELSWGEMEKVIDATTSIEKALGNRYTEMKKKLDEFDLTPASKKH